MHTENVAFVGLAGPLGYAYGHERVKLDNEGSSPNAVLENVAGLIICYDKIYFLSRQFCPVDMWDLPYVHFLVEEDNGLELASTAIRQAKELRDLLKFEHQLDFTEFDMITKAMQGSSFSAAIDNHTHGIDLKPDLTISGNANNSLNVVADILLAQALSLQTGEVDLIISSPAASSLTRKGTQAAGIAQQFEHPRLSLAQEITALTNRNFLSNKGSYDERYEELRQHKHIEEFRVLLCSMDVNMKDVSRSAAEVNKLADAYAGKVLSASYKKNWFTSLGVPVLKGVGNHIHPPLGTVSGAAVKYLLEKEEATEKKTMAWAPFVYDARRL